MRLVIVPLPLDLAETLLVLARRIDRAPMTYEESLALMYVENAIEESRNRSAGEENGDEGSDQESS